MGLIKTAMLVGGGMYAVNKFANARQNGSPQQDPNYSSRNQQQYVDNNAPQQQYYYQADQKRQQQSQQRVVPMEFTDRRSQSPEKQQQQNQPQYLLTNSSNAPVPLYAYDAQGGYYYEVDPRTNSSPAPQMAYADNSPPPQYQNSRQQRQGYVEPDEVASQSGYSVAGNGRGGSAFLDTLMQSAGGLKDGKGKDLMSKFLK